MTPVTCPQCGFAHTVHLFADDALLADVYACETCHYEWDEPYDICAAYEIIDDEDDEAAFAPPADSRED